MAREAVGREWKAQACRKALGGTGKLQGRVGKGGDCRSFLLLPRESEA